MISSVSAPSSGYQTQELSKPQGPPPPRRGSDDSQGATQVEGFDEALSQTAEAVGLSEEELSSLKLSIQDAVDTLDGETDPRAIGDAVSQELEEYGIDADEFHDLLGPPPSGGRGQSLQDAGTYNLTSTYQASPKTQTSGYNIFSNLVSLDISA